MKAKRLDYNVSRNKIRGFKVELPTWSLVLAPAIVFALIGIAILAFPKFFAILVAAFFIAFSLCVGFVTWKVFLLKKRWDGILSQVEQQAQFNDIEIQVTSPQAKSRKLDTRKIVYH